MQCDFFGKCGSCTLWKFSYEEQIELKANKIKDEFKDFYKEEIEIFTSKDGSFRNRAEFRIWHDKDKISYAMNGSKKNDIVCIDECHIVEDNILDMS